MKILFIEDEQNLQAIMSRYLEKEGFSVLQAYDGERGSQLARDGKPDLVLLDIILPKKDGFAVLKEMKENPETKEIPVIILTNLERSEDIERAVGLGAYSYLVKTNYEPRDIVERIKKILQPKS